MSANLKSYNARNVVNTVVNHCGFSRQYLISWINEIIGVERYSKIEELCDGVGYCLVMDKIFPDCLSTSKIKYDTKIEIYKLQNLKLLQGSMTRCKVSQDVPINLLIKGKYQDNFEYAQWFKKFFDCNSDCVDKENSSSSLRYQGSPKTINKPQKHIKNTFLPPCESPIVKAKKTLKEKNSFQKPNFKLSADNNITTPTPYENCPDLNKKIEELTLSNKMYCDKLKQIGEDMSDLINNRIKECNEDVIQVAVSDVLDILEYHQVEMTLDASFL